MKILKNSTRCFRPGWAVGFNRADRVIFDVESDGTVRSFRWVQLVYIHPLCLTSWVAITPVVHIGLMIGVLLFASLSLTILMVILTGILWIPTVTIGVLFVFSSYFMYALLRCYRYLRDKAAAQLQMRRTSRVSRSSSAPFYDSGYMMPRVASYRY